MTRGHTYARGIELGLQTYDWQNVPIGTWLGRLEIKVWGETAGGSLICCFTLLETGQKYRLTAYSAASNRKYTPRDGSIDFSEPGVEGQTFRLTVAHSPKGTLQWRAAEPVSAE